jgi:hypothetical protein
VPERLVACRGEPRNEAGNVVSRREAVADEEDVERVDASGMSLLDGLASLRPGLRIPPTRESSTIIKKRRQRVDSGAPRST